MINLSYTPEFNKYSLIYLNYYYVNGFYVKICILQFAIFNH